jgi:hypothetical protein
MSNNSNENYVPVNENNNNNTNNNNTNNNSNFSVKEKPKPKAKTTRKQKPTVEEMEAELARIAQEQAQQNGEDQVVVVEKERKSASPKKPFEKQSLPRSESFLGTALKLHTKHNTRNLYEKHSVPFQCEAVIGPVGKHRTCWLCGFPIEHLASLKDSAGNYVFEFDARKPNRVEDKIMDRGVCEHVLPVKLGYGILELFVLVKDPTFEKLLHTEYEYAHNHCNYIKSDEYFITLPLGSTSFCDLAIKEEIIDEILKMMYYKRRGSPHSEKSTAVSTVYKGVTLEFPNIVQAYCFTNDTARFLADKDAYFRDVWAPRAKAIIINKINRVISYIKEIDNCASTENIGTHFKGFEKRLKKGNTTEMPRGTKSPTKLESLDQSYLNRIARFQRAPSLNNILAGMSEEERVFPFRSPSFSGYTVNMNNNSRASTPTKSTRKGKKAKANTSEENTTSSGESSNTLQNTVNYKSLINYVDRMSREAEKNNIFTTMASPPSPPKLTRQKGTRKLKNTSVSPPTRKITNFFQGVTSAVKPKPKNKEVSTPVQLQAPTVQASAYQGPLLKNNLRMKTKNDGIYIYGDKTYNNRILLKGMGGVWNPVARSWVLPLGTNISSLLV